MTMRILISLFLLLLFSPFQSIAKDVPLGRVQGRIDCQGEAPCKGIAVLWRADDEQIPDPRKYTVIPVSVSPLKTDGVFELAAPAGEYFIGAILRKTPGPVMGPPRPGDLVFMTPDLEGKAVRVSLAANQLTDGGQHAAGWEFTGMNEQIEMGVSGQLVDLQGKPVAGLLVFAFADPEVTTSPLAVSARSGSDGRFQLPLATPGTIYLRARKTYRGGRPDPGDHVGVLGGNAPSPLQI